MLKNPCCDKRLIYVSTVCSKPTSDDKQKPKPTTVHDNNAYTEPVSSTSEFSEAQPAFKQEKTIRSEGKYDTYVSLMSHYVLQY